MEVLVVIAIIALALIIWGIKTYNALQAGKQSIIEQASNIKVSLQKRRDLSSRIIDIAKSVGDHEKLTHLHISTTHEASSANLAALSQNFPELKANETYQQLMQQLDTLETFISNKRESYNGSAKQYNSYRSSFPAMLIANMLKFVSAPYYDADNESSLDQLATFTRDDSEAVRELLSSSAHSLKDSARTLKNASIAQLEDVKNSDTVKSIIKQGDAVIGETIESIKQKSEALQSQPKEEIEESEAVAEKTKQHV